MGFEKSTSAFTTPILFLIFSRPETTRLVFEVIRSLKPAKLYVAADGPRDGRADDLTNCQEARRIATNVDWDCEVQTLFREQNLGCGKAPTNAISWFFEQESEGIILEDDCMPSPSFFFYCEELLARYRHDSRIMQITGINFDRDFTSKEYSYRFSNFTSSWGWASWRRAWKYHDFYMEHYQEVFDKKYLDLHFNSIYERDYYQYVFSKTYKGDSRNVWDYQWQFACQIQSGLAIVPERNLVINLGIGRNATNTTDPNGIGSDLKLRTIDFPLKHPEFVMVNRKIDREIFRDSWTTTTSRIRSNIKQIMPGPVVEQVKKPLKKIYYGFKINKR